MAAKVQCLSAEDSGRYSAACLRNELARLRCQGHGQGVGRGEGEGGPGVRRGGTVGRSPDVPELARGVRVGCVGGKGSLQDGLHTKPSLY